MLIQACAVAALVVPRMLWWRLMRGIPFSHLRFCSPNSPRAPWPRGQNKIGADIMMALDDVVSSQCPDRERVEEATHRYNTHLDMAKRGGGGGGCWWFARPACGCLVDDACVWWLPVCSCCNDHDSLSRGQDDSVAGPVHCRPLAPHGAEPVWHRPRRSPRRPAHPLLGSICRARLAAGICHRWPFWCATWGVGVRLGLDRRGGVSPVGQRVELLTVRRC